MTIFPIDLNLQLTQDRLIDIFILQWHTPLPAHDHIWKKIPPQLAEEKVALFDNFGKWLLNYFDVNTPSRPLFIVTPELSMPISCENLLDQIVNRINRPTVIIAGLQFLEWEEYSNLIHNLPCMPESATWLTDGHANHIVNAAGIWIRDANGEVKRYIQPKLHPQDHEQAIPVYQGQNVLVFRSVDQRTGPRLNFCVQICSDFSNADFVQQLRHGIAAKCEGLCLDLTFLIQCNPNQDSIQFKQAVQAYYEVPNGMTPTKQGCLLFVNNANEKAGKSKIWGCSKLHFPYETWRYLEFPPPTYWITNDKQHNHQAVTLRESGPGIYWLTYKPHYLVRRLAGSGQSVPFQGTPGFAFIDGTTFGQGTVADLFLPIPAVCHWLHGEWNEGKDELKLRLEENKTKQDVEENKTKQDVADYYLNLYRSGLDAWSQVIGHHDNWARRAVNTYFTCCKKEFYPAKETEPQEWHPDVSSAVKQMMRIYALLVAGVQAFPGGSISPNFEGLHHASAANELHITFLWGDGEIPPRKMITDYIVERENRGLCDLLSAKCFLILVNPAGCPDRGDLLEAIKKDGCDIVRQSSPDNASPHLQQEGDIVHSRGDKPLMWLYDGELLGEVDLAEDKNNLAERIKQIIGAQLS
ncbi:MAG: hypothetical protein KAV83_11690 [Desulfobacterales bacterium]|nr:hypothetical protein [Desulfobacterales bacterium]